MAKTEGTQSVPAPLLDAYRATLGEQRPNAAVHKRYPWRMPPMQEGGNNVTAKQSKHRDSFKIAVANFATTTPAERARWYAAMPPWSSFLWYYNYFLMSELAGNADIPAGGAGVIKSIQHKTISMPSGAGEGQVAITAIDPTKAVVMLFGSSASLQEETEFYIVVTVYPYMSSLAAELVKCKWSLPSPTVNDTVAADIGITVIEYV